MGQSLHKSVGDNKLKRVQKLLDKEAEGAAVTKDADCLANTYEHVPSKWELPRHADKFIFMEKFSCLHIAAYKGHGKMIELLIERKADVNIASKESEFKTSTDADGKTIFGNEDTFYPDRTPLFFAVHEGHIQAVATLLAHVAQPKNCLQVACSKGDFKTMKVLLLHGADPNQKQADGKAPIHILGQPDIIETLLEKKANIDLQDRHGGTACSSAASSGNTEVLKILVDHKCDLNIRDKAGFSPLMWAVTYKHTEAVRILMESGADANLRDKDGKTASDMTKNELHLKLIGHKRSGSQEEDKVESRVVKLGLIRSSSEPGKGHSKPLITEKAPVDQILPLQSQDSLDIAPPADLEFDSPEDNLDELAPPSYSDD